jgi:hypothetical protein
MFGARRRDDRQPWFATMIGVGPKSPWFDDERRTIWERVPVQHVEPAKPQRGAWWHRLISVD